MKCRLISICLLAALCGIANHVQAQARNTDEQQLIQLERDVAKANVTKDAAVMRRILADDYVEVTSRGTSHTKAEALAGLQSNSFTSFDADNLKVRIYGDAAVVTGRSTYSGTFEGVNYTKRQVLFTDTFVKKDGRWQEVASHATLIAAQQQK